MPYSRRAIAEVIATPGLLSAASAKLVHLVDTLKSKIGR